MKRQLLEQPTCTHMWNVFQKKSTENWLKKTIWASTTLKYNLHKGGAHQTHKA